MTTEKTNTTTTGQNTELSVSSTPVQRISVNVGVPGNMSKHFLIGSKLTIADALKQAELNASGYEIRMGGEPVRENAPLIDGATILLLRPIKGNN